MATLPLLIGDKSAQLALLCEQTQAISELLIDTDAYTGWSEEDVMRVMKPEGQTLSVCHHHLQELITPPSN